MEVLGHPQLGSCVARYLPLNIHHRQPANSPIRRSGSSNGSFFGPPKAASDGGGDRVETLLSLRRTCRAMLSVVAHAVTEALSEALLADASAVFALRCGQLDGRGPEIPGMLVRQVGWCISQSIATGAHSSLDRLPDEEYFMPFLLRTVTSHDVRLRYEFAEYIFATALQTASGGAPVMLLWPQACPVYRLLQHWLEAYEPARREAGAPPLELLRSATEDLEFVPASSLRSDTDQPAASPVGIGLPPSKSVEALPAAEGEDSSVATTGLSPLESPSGCHVPLFPASPLNSAERTTLLNSPEAPSHLSVPRSTLSEAKRILALQYHVHCTPGSSLSLDDLVADLGAFAQLLDQASNQKQGINVPPPFALNVSGADALEQHAPAIELALISSQRRTHLMIFNDDLARVSAAVPPPTQYLTLYGSSGQVNAPVYSLVPKKPGEDICVDCSSQLKMLCLASMPTLRTACFRFVSAKSLVLLDLPSFEDVYWCTDAQDVVRAVHTNLLRSEVMMDSAPLSSVAEAALHELEADFSEVPSSSWKSLRAPWLVM